MSNFCLYRFIAQKVCAFPIKTLCVSYKNTVRFMSCPAIAIQPKREKVMTGKKKTYYRYSIALRKK
jgi:hypothetical protein